LRSTKLAAVAWGCTVPVGYLFEGSLQTVRLSKGNRARDNMCWQVTHIKIELHHQRDDATSLQRIKSAC
jgi:hypothetical protein